MGIRAAFLLTFSLLSTLPSSGLDISGRVIDKLGRPVAGATACMDRPPGACATTDSAGAFRLVGEVTALGRATAAARRAPGLRLDAAGLVVRLPEGGPALLRWRDAGGRLLAAPARTSPRAGDHRIAPPPAAPGSGLLFLEAEAGGLRAAWRVVRLEGGGTGARGARPAAARVAALAKAAIASSDVLVAKEGYRPARYRPRRETETGVVVVLSAAADAGITYASGFRARVLLLDREEGRMITEASRDTCDGNTRVTVTFRDTTRFSVRDSSLWRWLPGECAGELFRGAGGDVRGSWSLVEPDFPLPPDARPAGCALDTLASAPLPPTVRESLTVSDTALAVRLETEVCPADLYVDLVRRFLLRDSAIALSRNACREAAWRNAAGEEAVMAFARRGADSLASTFAYKGANCAVAERLVADEGGLTRACAANDPAFAFLDCIAATGFFGDAPPPAVPAGGGASSLNGNPPQGGASRGGFLDRSLRLLPEAQGSHPRSLLESRSALPVPGEVPGR